MLATVATQSPRNSRGIPGGSAAGVGGGGGGPGGAGPVALSPEQAAPTSMAATATKRRKAIANHHNQPGVSPDGGCEPSISHLGMRGTRQRPKSVDSRPVREYDRPADAQLENSHGTVSRTHHRCSADSGGAAWLRRMPRAFRDRRWQQRPRGFRASNRPVRSQMKKVVAQRPCSVGRNGILADFDGVSGEALAVLDSARAAEVRFSVLHHPVHSL